MTACAVAVQTVDPVEDLFVGLDHELYNDNGGHPDVSPRSAADLFVSSVGLRCHRPVSVVRGRSWVLRFSGTNSSVSALTQVVQQGGVPAWGGSG